MGGCFLEKLCIFKVDPDAGAADPAGAAEAARLQTYLYNIVLTGPACGARSMHYDAFGLIWFRTIIIFLTENQ